MGISLSNHLKGHQVSNKLAIIGASGHGKVVADLAEKLGFDVLFFDDAYPEKTNVEHWLIRGTLLDFLATSDLYCGAVVAIGNVKVRESIITQLHELKICTPTLKHGSANVSQYATIDDGCVIMPGAVINAFSSIGKGCIINSNAVVEHDCKIDDFVHICPNAAVAGGTIIGKRTWVGIGSNIRQMVIIGADAFIGAGSAVVNDISTGTTVVGVPAKSTEIVK
jgi:sugar O-acyltransferase (sialic acid O-acetyltransferase NeuD family)